MEQLKKENEMVQDFTDLKVYRLAFDSAMRIFELSKTWPAEEKYSLTDQIRRSTLHASRSPLHALRSTTNNGNKSKQRTKK